MFEKLVWLWRNFSDALCGCIQGGTRGLNVGLSIHLHPYFRVTSSEQKALASLWICEDSPEPSLHDNVLGTTSHGLYILFFFQTAYGQHSVRSEPFPTPNREQVIIK